MFNKKHGESLVEVIVALGIIAFVFAGVVNIVANSVTVNVSARQRIEAVAMAQKGLNEFLAKSRGGDLCSISLVADVGTAISGEDCSAKTLTAADVNDPCYWVSVVSLDAAESAQLAGLTNDNFIKIISHAKWYTRILGEQQFEISRIVRNKP